MEANEPKRVEGERENVSDRQEAAVPSVTMNGDRVVLYQRVLIPAFVIHELSDGAAYILEFLAPDGSKLFYEDAVMTVDRDDLLGVAEKRGEERTAAADVPESPATKEDAPEEESIASQMWFNEPIPPEPEPDTPSTQETVLVERLKELEMGWRRMAGDINTMPNTHVSFMCCANELEALLESVSHPEKTKDES